MESGFTTSVSICIVLSRHFPEAAVFMSRDKTKSKQNKTKQNTPKLVEQSLWDCEQDFLRIGILFCSLLLQGWVALAKLADLSLSNFPKANYL